MLVWGGAGAAFSGGRYGLDQSEDGDFDGYTTCSGDCDDADPLVHPDGVDLPGDLPDQDCSGSASCDPAAFWVSHGNFVACVAGASFGASGKEHVRFSYAASEETIREALRRIRALLG